MSEKESRIAQTMADALTVLPEEKKEYFLGFAEGVAAMADQVKTKPRPEPDAPNTTGAA